MMSIAAQPLHTPSRQPLLELPDLVMRGGECWALLGPNGAGKSTFLRHCAGHDPQQPASGWHWQGKPLPLWSDGGWARTRSFLPQQHHLTASLTVAALVRMAAYPWGGAHARLDAEFGRAVTAWDLGHLLARRWHELSGGEQQRVQLARSALQLALAEPDQPRLWLLDEPLAALDWPHQQTAVTACRAAAEAGALVLVSVHDMNAALAMATHVLVMGQGRVLMHGAIVGKDQAGNGQAETGQSGRQDQVREALETAFSARLGWVSHPEDGRPWLVPLR